MLHLFLVLLTLAIVRCEKYLGDVEGLGETTMGFGFQFCGDSSDWPVTLGDGTRTDFKMQVNHFCYDENVPLPKEFHPNADSDEWKRRNRVQLFYKNKLLDNIKANSIYNSKNAEISKKIADSIKPQVPKAGDDKSVTVHYMTTKGWCRIVVYGKGENDPEYAELDNQKITDNEQCKSLMKG